MAVRPGASSHFYVQPILNDIFHDAQLLELGSPERATSPPTASNTPPLALNRLSQFVSSTAAAAAQRRSFRNGATSPPRMPRSGSASDLALANGSAECVAGYGNSVYVGTSDGSLLWYVIEPVPGVHQPLAYHLRARQTVYPRAPISRILLLPPIGKLLVLSDGTLHFFSLPSLEPVPPGVIGPLRGVVAVALDDQEMGMHNEEGQAETVMSLVIVKRRTVVLYRLGARLVWLQDIPVPETPLQVVRAGATLCLADSSKYCVIDLAGPHLIDILPISQSAPPDPDDADAFHPEACIAVLPGEQEFLFCSYMGEAGSMGVFVDKAGDAVRGTITWTSHPMSLAIEGDSVLALLHDSTIVIHSIAAIEMGAEPAPQVIPFPSDLGARSLSSNAYGIMIAHHERDEKMRLVSVPLMAKGAAVPSAEPTAETTESSKDLPELPASPSSPDEAATPVPPASSAPESLLTASIRQAPPRAKIPPGPFTTTIAETLLVMSDSVVAIAALAWITKAEQMLDAGRTEECVRLVDEEKRKSRRGDIDGDRATHAADLRYIQTRLALAYLKEALFEEAISHFSRAKVDPRIVCRMFPDLVGGAIKPEDEVQIWQGLEQCFKDVPELQAIITQTARTGGGGRNTLVDLSDPDNPEELERTVANNFLIVFKEYLRKTRASRRKNPTFRPVEKQIDTAVDTCLVKALAQSGEIDEMVAILQAPNNCLLDELEPYLVTAQQPWILSRVLLQLGRTERVLEIMVDIADGKTPDKRAEDPVQEVASLLPNVSDAKVLRKYGLWLVEKDVEAGLEIFTSQDIKKGVRFDDRSLLADLKKINEDAASRYLEHVVVQRRSADRQLHDALANLLLDRCEAFLADDGVKYHFNEIYDEYIATRPPKTYFAYFADLAQESPSKTARLQTILFLQGSPFYDIKAIASRVESIELLTYETAIVLGRLGQHQRALRLLALTLKDAVSAETYCSQGGEVLPPKIARAVVARLKYLEPWAALGEIGRRRKGTIGGEVRQMLVRELLKAYMSDGAASSKQTAALLNAQAIHLDVNEVIDLVPEEWPLHTVSDFIGRSLKQQLHERSTWQILKAISAGQNMATAEQYALEMGKRPPYIDATSPPAFSPPDEGSIADQEYSSLREKKFDFGSEFGSAASEKEKSPMEEGPPASRSGTIVSSEKHVGAVEGPGPAVGDSLK